MDTRGTCLRQAARGVPQQHTPRREPQPYDAQGNFRVATTRRPTQKGGTLRAGIRALTVARQRRTLTGLSPRRRLAGHRQACRHATTAWPQRGRDPIRMCTYSRGRIRQNQIQFNEYPLLASLENTLLRVCDRIGRDVTVLARSPAGGVGEATNPVGRTWPKAHVSLRCRRMGVHVWQGGIE